MCLGDIAASLLGIGGHKERVVGWVMNIAEGQ